MRSLPARGCGSLASRLAKGDDRSTSASPRKRPAQHGVSCSVHKRRHGVHCYRAPVRAVCNAGGMGMLGIPANQRYSNEELVISGDLVHLDAIIEQWIDCLMSETIELSADLTNLALFARRYIEVWYEKKRAGCARHKF